MIRNFFFALGVLFAAMIAFCAGFFGSLGYEMHARGPANEQLAVDITRQISLSWSANDVKSHYAKEVGGKVDSEAAQEVLDALKPLGPLRSAEQLAHKTRLAPETLSEIDGAPAAATILAELLSKTVTVTFTGKFTNADARVTIELRSEGGAMKLWHLEIESLKPLPHPAVSAPQEISRV